jgi:hypothetical protein
MKRGLLLIAWGVTRLISLALWCFFLPIAEINVWLREQLR